MRPALLLLISAAFISTSAAQTVEWQSLEGPWGGYVHLVGTTEGVAFRSLDGEVERSDDGGLTWIGTGFPGSGVRALDVGHDGSLLAAAATGAYRFYDDVWSLIGPEGSGVRRVGAASDGTTFIWQTGCTFVRSTDLETWQHFTPGAETACIDMLVTPNGEVLVLRRIWEIVLSFWVDHSTDGGETWTSRSPGEHVQRLVAGQHGGIFAIAPPSADGWGGFPPPRTYRWTGSGWEVIATEHVTGLTTLPSGEIVFGYRHGFDDGALAGPLSRPTDLVRSADGSWLASTEWAGMWRRSASNDWHQIAGRPWTSSVLVRDQAGHLAAGFLGSLVHFDGDHWRHGLWTRGLVRGVAALPERTFLASPGYTGEGVEWHIDHGVGIWDIEADTTVQVAECFGDACLPNALIRAEGVVIASLGGEVMVCRPGDERCAAGMPGGLFRSEDGGESWQASLPGYGNLCHLAAPGGGVVWAGAGLYYMADCPVASYGYLPKAERVFRSDDLGETWSQVGQALPEPYVTALAADDEGAAVALPTHQVYLIAPDGTVDGIGGPGPAIRSVGIAINRAPLAGTDDGLFAFDGVTWRSMGLAGLQTEVIKVEDDGVVYVATSHGVYRTTEPLIVSTEGSAAPAAAALESIHPNPAVGEVTISFTLAEARAVELAVYDLLGRRVRTFAAGTRAAGRHEVVLEVGGFAAGVYVVELTAAGERWVRRVSILGP